MLNPKHNGRNGRDTMDPGDRLRWSSWHRATPCLAVTPIKRDVSCGSSGDPMAINARRGRLEDF
ncbi:MAG: hypothetical protein ACO3S0_12065 [bacterium]